MASSVCTHPVSERATSTTRASFLIALAAYRNLNRLSGKVMSLTRGTVGVGLTARTARKKTSLKITPNPVCDQGMHD